MIYLDNAATSFLKPPAVAQAVFESFSSLGNASRGVNRTSLQAERLLYELRVALADMFEARPKQVAFNSGSTEGLNTVLQGYLTSKDHVLTTVMEHNSVLRPLYRLGCELSTLPISLDGRLNVSSRDALVQPNTKAVVITHVSNLTGVENDLMDWGKWCAEREIALIVDASQSAGVLPISLEKMNISALCITGHKGLFGAQGTGALILKEGFKVDPLKVGGSGVQTFSRTHPEQMPTRLEAGTLNLHGLSGLKAGVDFIRQTGLDTIHMKEMALRSYFLEQASDLPLEYYGATQAGVAIVALNAKGMDSSELGEALEEQDIVIRSGGHCAPLHHEAFGTVQRGMVRFSFSYFNTLDDIDTAVKALRNILLQESL